MNIFENKKVCVFGGTGSVGSLIVEYLMKQKPSVIRVFSNDENSLWESQQKWGDDKIRYLLGDIRNYERVKLALTGIDYVFNCAAIKHVPFAEYNPMEAVNVNIIGLENIIKACWEKKVKKLLHISTDKACYATCFMGATKFLSERLLQVRSAQNINVELVCVRSGNIKGSRGSIIPYIEKCRKKGDDIGITDIAMERYFIEPEKFCKFIMRVFKNGKQGDIWIPKMESIKIIDLVKDSGIGFKIIGRRKGEKLREILYTDEEVPNISEKEDHYIIKNTLWETTKNIRGL